MIAAINSYLLAFDNLSGLSHWLSDALCRLATGGSFAVRQLYTDDEEVLFEASRPIPLNGIEEMVGRPDLGDRAIFLTLAPIEEAHRRPEKRAVAGVRVRTAPHPRRAARRGGAWAAHQQYRSPRSAAAHGRFRSLGGGLRTSLLAGTTFARAYAANRRAAIESIIEADPLATCVRPIMDERTSWSGSA
jgi:hypothetical protein